MGGIIMKKKIISIISMLLFLFNMIIVSGAVNNLDELSNLTVNINGAIFELDSDTNKIYELPQLRVDALNYASIEDGETRYSVLLNGNPLGAEKTEFALEEIGCDKYISLEIKDLQTGQLTKSSIRTYPLAAPQFIAEQFSDKINSGTYYFTLDNYLLKTDTQGNIVFYWYLGQTVLDFKKHKLPEENLYSFALGSTEGLRLGDVGYVPAREIVMDEEYNVIDDIPYLLENETVRARSLLDSHDFMILGRGHYVVMGYYGKTVFNIPDELPHAKYGTRVAAIIIQEIKDNKVVWQWDSTNYPELYYMSTTADYYNKNEQWNDYAHMNSIDIDPDDGNYICSFRNLSTILKIDSLTGDIIWALGGALDEFGLTDEQKPSYQHHARYTPDGSITIFDNGNDLHQSRVVEYWLDEDNKELLKFQEYIVGQEFSSTMGSAQKLNDDIFAIGWGGRDTKSPVFSVIDFGEEVPIFHVVYPVGGFSQNSYRVYYSNSN